jgi:L-lysine exporter family protein LysE/ArgO
LGVFGAAGAFVQFPWLKILFGILGVGFLAYYGFLKLKEKPKPQSGTETQSVSFVPLKVVVLQTLAFSLLNPHVYLDTVILIGGYSAKFAALFERGLFGLGASSFSVIWFFGLTLGAAAMSSYLNNPKVMRVVSLVSGVILLSLAGKLGMDVWKWV